MIKANELTLPESASIAKAQVAEVIVEAMRDLISCRGIGPTNLTLDIVDCACLVELIDSLKRKVQ